ncbi:hypothetical protein FRC08_001865 [Ceratobasidium sp. 394]|nr:hypothetical protein FRC08_001865 [Ceratobasidium sp. 394]
MLNSTDRSSSALQIFVLGSKLRSKPGAKFPVLPAIALFFHRFILMPAIMISVVYLLRAHWPNYVERDPMLDFVLSIIGIGPPAITLAAVSSSLSKTKVVNLEPFRYLKWPGSIHKKMLKLHEL